MFKLDFTGKVVCVSGASRGIGAAVAVAFRDLGAVVCGSAPDDEGVEDICKAMEGHGCGLKMNFLEEGSIEKFFAEAKEKCGAAPDILVNNAGITRDGLFLRMKKDDWDSVIACNLNGHVRLSQLCVSPMLRKRWGRIISIASVVGETGNAGQCNYAASKAGLIGFSMSLAKEVAARGITVNCVAPGFVDTVMTRQLKPEQLKQWTDSIPVKRAATADDIAGAVIFLASDLASYITGITLDVNGGMYCG